MTENTDNMLNKWVKAKKKAAHEVLMKDVQTELSSLSGSEVSKDVREDSLRDIEADCKILGQMDIPQGVQADLFGQIEKLVTNTKAEINAKTSAVNTIYACLKQMKAA